MISMASALVVHREIQTLKKPQIVVENPVLAFTTFTEVVAEERYKRPAGIYPTAIISKEAIIGKGVSIGAYVVIDDSVCIGNHVTIYPNTFIGKESRIGDHSINYANVS